MILLWLAGSYGDGMVPYTILGGQHAEKNHKNSPAPSVYDILITIMMMSLKYYA